MERVFEQNEHKSTQVKVPKDFCDRRICILGLGFVGLTLATVMADVGFEVIGIEIRDNVLEMLKSGDPYFFEPGLSDHLKRVISNGQLKVYKKIPNPSKATVYIITVGTPLDENGNVNLSSIQNICEDISLILNDDDLIILRSTVKLGTTRRIAKPILESCNKKIQIAFCPERTVEGQAMVELRYLPQIIGSDNLATSLRASQLFQFLTPTVVRVSDFETAEMIKLIDNTKRDVMFAFSNEVARICDATGLSADEVISSGRFGYSRTNLPTPGPVGGPCLSKDSHILAQSVENFGIIPEMTIAARKINEQQPVEVVNFLKNLLIKTPNFPENPKISLLGIAFKGRPSTDDIRGTTAKPIFAALKSAFPKGEFLGFDPVIDSNTLEESFNIKAAGSIDEAFSNANLVLILNNHHYFSSISLDKLSSNLATPAVIYDFWNTFTRVGIHLPDGVQYIALGSHLRPVIGTNTNVRNLEYA